MHRPQNMLQHWHSVDYSLPFDSRKIPQFLSSIAKTNYLVYQVISILIIKRADFCFSRSLECWYGLISSGLLNEYIRLKLTLFLWLEIEN